MNVFFQKNMAGNVWESLIHGFRDFVGKAGFTDVVLGLSGGIDSALVAALAVDALGSAHVHGVLMPSPWSSKGSIVDSRLLAKNLGIETQTIPIAPLMSSFEVALAPVFAGYGADVTEENLQSRIRGVLLMALSNKFHWMLLCTGNRSEIMTGYCTLYGDTCGSLAPIGELYKGEVYQLARWFNQREGRARIPQAILDKPPSAELRPGQLDQDSLPPYDVLDVVLRSVLEGSIVSGAGTEFDPVVVDRVIALVEKSAFKRRFLAPALCVER